MSDQQQLRNALTQIEDEARALRNRAPAAAGREVAALLVRLTQLVREEIVK